MLLGWGGGRLQCYWDGEEGGHNVIGTGRREVRGRRLGMGHTGKTFPKSRNSTG